MTAISDWGQGDAAAFRTTHWSIVLTAGQTHSADQHESLAKLCKIYWYPLYAYIRRRGHHAPDAQDLTQEFFARLLEKEVLNGVTREGGKFRSFLLTALKRFLANEWAKSQAQKRGGGQNIVPLEIETAEGLYALEPVDHLTPEILFERRWAATLLNRAMTRLENEYRNWKKADLLKKLQMFLCGSDRNISCKELGAQLGMSEGAVRVALSRLRRRYRELVREEIARTVSTPEEIDEEIKYLVSVLC
jgi:RNA polymerase sigma factor (sigma-70 family)